MSETAGAPFHGTRHADVDTLMTALADVRDEPLLEMRRADNPSASSALGEVLTCTFADGSSAQYLVKYLGGKGESHGHRGDHAYEAKVYRHLLAPLDLPPRLVGVVDRAPDVLLITEYVAGAVPISKVRKSPPAVVDAASWLASYHRRTRMRLHDGTLTFLKTYDADYYLGWSRRLRSYRISHDHECRLCQRVLAVYDDEAATLVQGDVVIIHGEFVPRNVLMDGGRVFAVDWESAAVGAAAIDLAALTDGWSRDVADDCIRAYVDARWEGAAPAGFKRQLWVAQIHWQLRWLGDRPEWAARAGRRRERLHQMADEA